MNSEEADTLADLLNWILLRIWRGRIKAERNSFKSLSKYITSSDIREELLNEVLSRLYPVTSPRTYKTESSIKTLKTETERLGKDLSSSNVT